MTLLLNCHQLSKAYGSRQLFREISLGIFKGDKIGLIGPNGSGKSTLLKILSGIDSPDDGNIASRKGLRVGYVPQSSEYADLPIIEIVMAAYKGHEIRSTHDLETQAKILLSKIGFEDPYHNANALSGGWKKRLDIAKELISAPEVLFLDEPTNHLDIEGILWLEDFLKRESVAFVVTSHDRYFLQNVVKRMMELNSIYPQGLLASDGNYADFLQKREDFLNQQMQSERSLASKVRYETEWLKQSPKARTVKAQARVQGAGRLIEELSEIRARQKQGKAKIDFEATDRQTHKLLAIKNLSKTLNNRVLFSGLDITFVPGMRLGIVGANGSGKTTLLKLLAGELQPDKGTVKYADNLKIVYFDQHRQKLSPDLTLRQALSPNSDTVIYRGQHIHVNSWAKRFLFSPSRLDLPVKQLSGGERARIGIAKLMLQPADLLLLDEPTNDLDIPTLETLEESLKEFPGAIVLITHDRALLDSLANTVIGLGVAEKPPLLADYYQWENFVRQYKGDDTSSEDGQVKKKESQKTAPTSQLKLSYHEKKELDKMEAAILTAEEEIRKWEAIIHDHSTHQRLSDLQEAYQKMAAIQKEHDRLFHRWQELENKLKGTL